MNGRENGKEARSLPPCPFTAKSLLFSDELSIPANAQAENALLPLIEIDDLRDERLLAQLRSHVPTCPTCTSALKEQRRLQEQQRVSIHSLLLEGERRVPSTTSRIIAAVRPAEQSQMRPTSSDAQQRAVIPESLPLTRLNGHIRRSHYTPAHRRRVLLSNIVSLAIVAVVVLAALVLFSQLLSRRSLTSTPGLQYTNGWDAAVVGIAQQGHLAIENYDPLSGKYASLVSSPVPDNASIDGVSHDGHNLLYHYSKGGHTYYYTLTPLAHTGYFYELNSTNVSNALWMSDSRNVLIATNHNEIMEVDTQTGAAKIITSSINFGRLWFYRDNYLYYDNTNKSPGIDLFRINIVTGQVQLVTKTVIGRSFLLSPDGTTIFYADRIGGNAIADSAIYTVSTAITGSSAANRQLLLSINAVPIGFAADNTLMLMQEVNHKFQVVKLKPTQPAIDRVVASDAAPGAAYLCDNPAGNLAPICDENVALAPYGHMLIVAGTYPNAGPNHSERRLLWADDLTTGKQHVLQTVNVSSQAIQLVGWDRIAVPDATLASAVVSSPTPTGLAQQNYGWNSVVMAYVASADWLAIDTYDYRQGEKGIVDHEKPPANTQIDGISPDGKNLLYQFALNGHTLYWTLNLLSGTHYAAYTGFFFELDSHDAGNALWLPDSQHVFIETTHSGTLQVDTQTGAAQAIFPSLTNAHLTFYINGYLYYNVEGTLYRISVATHIVQKITFRSPGATFWLSPDGSIIYFVNNTGNAGTPGLYAVSSDGSSQPVLLRNDGVPIGFADDNALVIIRDVNGIFQVVKVGAIPNQDQVLLNNVASGAISLCNTGTAPGIVPICDSNIALAPYGHVLVVQAIYPHGVRKVLSIDITTGQRILLLPSSQSSGQDNAPVVLVGWGRNFPAESG